MRSLPWEAESLYSDCEARILESGHVADAMDSPVRPPPRSTPVHHSTNGVVVPAVACAYLRFWKATPVIPAPTSFAYPLSVGSS